MASENVKLGVGVISTVIGLFILFGLLTVLLHVPTDAIPISFYVMGGVGFIAFVGGVWTGWKNW